MGGRPQAQLAVLHSIDGGWEVEYLNIDYNIDKIINDFRTSGFLGKGRVWARAVMKNIMTGTICTLPCLERARELAEEYEGIKFDGNIPEKYWEMAACELGI